MALPLVGTSAVSANSGLEQGWLNTFAGISDVACGVVTYECDEFVKSSREQSSVFKPLSVAVRSVDVVGVVVDFGMDLTVSQLFENRDSVVKDVYYLFPVDESHGLYRLEYKCYSPVIRNGPGSREGESFQTMVVKIADSTYHQKQDKGAGCCGTNNYDVVKIHIGPVAPMTIIHVKIGIVQEIKEVRESEDQLMVISIPNVFFPNFGFRSSGSSSLEQSDTGVWGFLQNQHYALHAQYPVKLHFRVYQQFPCNFTSVSNLSLFRVQDTRGIRKTFDDDSWYQYCIQGITAKSDVVGNIDINVSPALEFSKDSRLILEHHNGQSIATLSVCVGFEPVISSEVIFLMDQSGSMIGKPLTLSKLVLKEMLNEFPKTISFNVVGYGSDYELFFKQSKLASSQDVLEQAVTYIDNAAATLGGSDLIRALETTIKTFSTSCTTKIIIILSDGQMDNCDEVLTYIRDLKQEFRIFTIAVSGNDGLDQSRNMKMLAAAGGGCCEIVNKPIDVTNCVKSIKSELLQSSVEIDSIIFSSCTDRRIFVPFLPNVVLNDIDSCKIYCGRPSRIFAQFPQRTYPDLVGTELNIKGDHGIESIHVRSYKSPINHVKDIGPNIMFHRLFAQRFIASAKNQLRGLNKLTTRNDFAGTIEFVKYLSKTYNLMTPYSYMTFFGESKFLVNSWAVDTRYGKNTRDNNCVVEASPDFNAPSAKKRRATVSPPAIKELYNCEFSIPVIRDLMVERNASVLIQLQLPDGSFDLERNFFPSFTMFNYLSQARPRRKFLTKEKWATSLAFVILSNNLGVWSESPDIITKASEMAVTWMINNLAEIEISECIYSAYKVLWTYLTSESSIEPVHNRKRQSYKRFYS